MGATVLSIEQSMHPIRCPLMQVHTTPKILHIQLHAGASLPPCSFTDSRQAKKQRRREISHGAEGVSAISVIPQGDLRLLQQAVQQEAVPRMPAYSA